MAGIRAISFAERPVCDITMETVLMPLPLRLLGNNTVNAPAMIFLPVQQVFQVSGRGLFSQQVLTLRAGQYDKLDLGMWKRRARNGKTCSFRGGARAFPNANGMIDTRRSLLEGLSILPEIQRGAKRSGISNHLGSVAGITLAA